LHNSAAIFASQGEIWNESQAATIRSNGANALKFIRFYRAIATPVQLNYTFDQIAALQFWKFW
jgi:tagatose-1,6-bisphosphate aldolase